MKNDHSSFERICHAVLEGSATEAELEQFRQRLHSNAAERKDYADQAQIHALLTWQKGRAAVPVPFVLAPTDFPASSNIIAFSFRKAILAAAAVLVVGFAVWQIADRGQNDGAVAVAHGTPAAVKKGVVVDILASTDTPYQVGQRVVLERLELNAGSLRFRISSGAVVDVEGPVALEFVDPMRMRLIRGNVTTDVGSDAKGFVVDTDSATVLDIGTRFGVSRGDDGSTDIVVLQGEVQVYRAGVPKSPETRLASLYEGEGARMTARDAKIQRLQAAALRGDRLAIRGLNAPDSSVISNVSDNIKKANFYRCYTIVPGGMAEGAPASLTKMGHNKLTWHAMPGQLFPADLKGADVIGTFQGEVIRQPLADINLELTRPCAVYVLFDTRATPPEWLTRDFRDTGMRLRSGPWWPDLVATQNLKPDKNGEIHIEHAVWRKDVSSPGTVTLGAVEPKRGIYPYAMYGIAVKAF